MVPESLMAAIEVLHGVRRKGPSGKLASEVLRLLEDTKKELEGTAPTHRISARTGVQVEYFVAQDALCEQRLNGKSRPFKSPKPVYDAMVQIFASMGRPLALDEITAEANRLLGGEAADFQIRVVQRCWMHTTPPLIMRSRARYRAKEPTSFISKATKLWTSLRTG